MVSIDQSPASFLQLAGLMVRATMHAYVFVVVDLLILYWWRPQLVVPLVDWSLIIGVGGGLLAVVVVVPPPVSRTGWVWKGWLTLWSLATIAATAYLSMRSVTGQLGVVAAIAIGAVGVAVYSVCARR